MPNKYYISKTLNSLEFSNLITTSIYKKQFSPNINKNQALNPKL